MLPVWLILIYRSLKQKNLQIILFFFQEDIETVLKKNLLLYLLASWFAAKYDSWVPRSLWSRRYEVLNQDASINIFWMPMILFSTGLLFSPGSHEEGEYRLQFWAFLLASVSCDTSLVGKGGQFCFWNLLFLPGLSHESSKDSQDLWLGTFPCGLHWKIAVIFKCLALSKC